MEVGGAGSCMVGFWVRGLVATAEAVCPTGVGLVIDPFWTMWDSSRAMDCLIRANSAAGSIRECLCVRTRAKELAMTLDHSRRWKEDVQLSIITHKVGCSAIDEPRHLRGSKQAARIGKRGESITHDKFAPILGVSTWEGAPK